MMTEAHAAAVPFPVASCSATQSHDNKLFWSNDADELEVSPSLLHFTVRGKPIPQARHRNKFGRAYDPSARPKKAFKDTVHSILFQKIRSIPHFGSREVGITIVFRQSRPKFHWVGSKRGGKLKPGFASAVFPTSRGDIDNLQKFVFDALSGIAYYDDGQIVSVCATKVIDNIDTCEGATTVTVFPITKDMVQSLSKQQVHVVHVV